MATPCLGAQSWQRPSGERDQLWSLTLRTEQKVGALWFLRTFTLEGRVASENPHLLPEAGVLGGSFELHGNVPLCPPQVTGDWKRALARLSWFNNCLSSRSLEAAGTRPITLKAGAVVPIFCHPGQTTREKNNSVQKKQRLKQKQRPREKPPATSRFLGTVLPVV